MPGRIFAPASHTNGNDQQDAFFAQRTVDLAVPPAVALPAGQLAHEVQPHRVFAIPTLPARGNITDHTPFTGATADANVYSYPGILKPGGFFVPVSSSPESVNTVPVMADIAVPATGQPAAEDQPPTEPPTGELEVSNPALRAWVRTYIY